MTKQTTERSEAEIAEEHRLRVLLQNADFPLMVFEDGRCWDEQYSLFQLHYSRDVYYTRGADGFLYFSLILHSIGSAEHGYDPRILADTRSLLRDIEQLGVPAIESVIAGTPNDAVTHLLLRYRVQALGRLRDTWNAEPPATPPADAQLSRTAWIATRAHELLRPRHNLWNSPLGGDTGVAIPDYRVGANINMKASLLHANLFSIESLQQALAGGHHV